MKDGYIPTLDGWRAIAVFSVIAFHDRVHHFGPISDSIPHSLGALGVDLFFAISGLLICSRLLDEERVHQHISLKSFYVRRLCRILPPALLFLTVLGVLGSLHVLRVDFASWLCSLIFVNNYYFAHLRNPDVSLFTNHFWSLAVEEHFYLVLPGILYFSPKRHLRVLTILIAAFLIYSITVHMNQRPSDTMAGFAELRTEMRINSLLFPALLAVLLQKSRFREFCAHWLPTFLVFYLLLVALILCASLNYIKAFFWIVPYGFPFLILGTVLHPNSYFSRMLETAPLRYLGRISYSLYLWQQLFFIDLHLSFRAPWPASLLQDSPWNLVAAILLASGSYYFVEKPFIRLGHRLAPPATPGHHNL